MATKSILRYADVEARVEVTMHDGGRVSARAFSGKRTRPDFNCLFGNAKQAEKYIGDWHGGLVRRAEAKAAERAALAGAKKVNPFKVGDILSYSWGWEQTNVNFFEVTEVKGASVVIRELAQNHVETTGAMSGTCTPKPEVFRGDAQGMLKRVQAWMRGDKPDYYLRMEHGFAFLWDGKPEHYSTYA